MTSSSVRALQCYDILEQLLIHFAPSQFHRKQLAQLARVSRVFAIIALKLLWSELDDVTPALKLFSSFEILRPPTNNLWFDDDDDDDSSYEFLSSKDSLTPGAIYRLRGTILPEEWTRFHQYARRIRTINLCCGPHQVSRATVLVFLANQNPSGTYLFPQLREIRWESSSSSDMSIIPLVSPSLCHVSLDYLLFDDRMNIDPSFDLIALLNVVFSVSPSLETLEIFGDVSFPQLYMPSPWPQRLRKMHLSPSTIDVHMFNIVAGLEHLEELFLKVRFVDGDTADLSRSGFKSLHTLRLVGQSGHMTRFLTKVTSPMMRVLDLYEDKGTDPTQWRKCLTTVSSIFTSLHRITFGITHEMHKTPEILPVAMLIGPLTAIRGLQALEVTFPGSTPVTEDDLVSMVSAWPQLQLFKLQLGRMVLDHPVLHPRIMLDFLRLCPKLTDLTLPKVALEPETLAELAPVSTPWQDLKNLDLGYREWCHVSDTTRAARFIDSLCPNVCTRSLLLDTARDIDDWDVSSPDVDKEGTWTMVVNDVAELQAARVSCGKVELEA